MKSPLKISCDKCLRRPYCTELCDRAEEYVNQDQVPQREKTLGRPATYGTYSGLERYAIPPGVVLNSKQLCVLVLVSSGVPRSSIRSAMGISVDNFNNILSRIRNKYKKIGIEND